MQTFLIRSIFVSWPFSLRFTHIKPISQKRRLEPEYLRRRSNLRDITHLLHSLEMHMERNSRRALGADDSDPGAPPRHLWSHIETRESVLDNHRHHQVATTGRVPQVAATSSSVDPHNLHNHHDATYQEIPELMDGFNRLDIKKQDWSYLFSHKDVQICIEVKPDFLEYLFLSIIFLFL